MTRTRFPLFAWLNGSDLILSCSAGVVEVTRAKL